MLGLVSRAFASPTDVAAQRNAEHAVGELHIQDGLLHGYEKLAVVAETWMLESMEA